MSMLSDFSLARGNDCSEKEKVRHAHTCSCGAVSSSSHGSVCFSCVCSVWLFAALFPLFTDVRPLLADPERAVELPVRAVCGGCGASSVCVCVCICVCVCACVCASSAASSAACFAAACCASLWASCAARTAASFMTSYLLQAVCTACKQYVCKCVSRVCTEGNECNRACEICMYLCRIIILHPFIYSVYTA